MRSTISEWYNSLAMPHDFFDPTPEQQNVIPIDAATLDQCERLIEACEYCNPLGADSVRLDSGSRYGFRSERYGLRP
jgi:hypothetical protein